MTTPPPHPQRQKPLILVTDDDPSVRELHQRFLAPLYDVLLAEDAASALAQLRRGAAPDVIIADLDMPGMPGEDMSLAILRDNPRQKILYVTANIDRLLDQRSIAWDGEAFLEKPFTRRGLLEAVSLLLTGRIGQQPNETA
jgi:CheY-like chemotaxis protein